MAKGERRRSLFSPPHPPAPSSSPFFFCQCTLRLPRLLLERSSDGCDLDGFISPLQKGSYGKHFPPVGNIVKDFLHYLPPVPATGAPPRSDKAASLRENGFSLQRISDKDGKREECARGGCEGRRATEEGHAHPTTGPELVNFPCTSRWQLSPAL